MDGSQQLPDNNAKVTTATTDGASSMIDSSPSPLIETRANIYDGDEFDVIERDTVDKTKIQRGKKDFESVTSVLNDKSDLVKEKFAALGIVTDIEVIDAGAGDEGDEYDDEYDDTYDTNAMGEREPDSMDDILSRREFVLPRVLGGGHVATEARRNNGSQEDEVGASVFIGEKMNYVRTYRILPSLSRLRV